MIIEINQESLSPRRKNIEEPFKSKWDRRKSERCPTLRLKLFFWLRRRCRNWFRKISAGELSKPISTVDLWSANQAREGIDKGTILTDMSNKKCKFLKIRKNIWEKSCLQTAYISTAWLLQIITDDYQSLETETVENGCLQLRWNLASGTHCSCPACGKQHVVPIEVFA